MLEQFIRFITHFFPALTSFYIINTYSQKKLKILNYKTIATLLILTTVTLLFYNSDYSVMMSVMMYICSVIIYKLLFKFDLSKSIIISGLMIILMIITELILFFVFMPFINLQSFRQNAFQNLLMNILTALVTISISQIPIIKSKLTTFIEKLEEIKACKIIIFLISVIIVLCLFIYIMFNNYKISVEYIIAIFSSIVFILLLVLYLHEQLEYNRLNKEFNFFIEYVTTLEDWIDTECLNNHEYKNDLAILRTKVTNKEAIKFIDKKLTDKLKVDDRWINELKNVPKGGLKGLIYYKIILAHNQKINISINVSSKATSALRSLKKDDIKDLCHLVGIFFDNALDAAIMTRKKAVALEVYLLNNKLNIVISNTYKDKIDLDRFGKHGFSSKGTGHGNGLYFAKKIIDNNPRISQNRRIVKDLYVQRITL